MKAISIQQPWADLICSGVKDVENRSWKPTTVPMRVLITSSSTRSKLKNEDMLPLCWLLPVENAQLMGNLFDLGSAPLSAVVGVATIADYVEQSDSVWAQEGKGAEYKWIIKDAQFFAEPIEGIKGKLHFYDVPEVDENNLPPLVPHYEMKREAAHLYIPVNELAFNQVANGEGDTINFNLVGDVVDYLVDAAGKELQTNKVTLFCGDSKLECDVDIYEAFDVLDEETNEPIIYDDPAGREYVWRKIQINLSNIRKV